MINFQKAFKIGRPLFEREGKQVLRKHRATIFDKGQDSHEKSFESYAPYKPKYRERKFIDWEAVESNFWALRSRADAGAGAGER